MSGYGTDEGFSAYADEMGYTVSGEVSAARARGSAALDAAYATRWVGTPVWGQERAWPRTDATWPDGSTIAGIPDAVVRASYEYAYRELRSPGSMSPVVTPGRVKVRSRVEGAVDVSYAQDQNRGDEVKFNTPVSVIVEGMLDGLVSTRISLPGIVVV